LIAARLAHAVVKPLVADAARLAFALDDTPTERYGRHVQGAGVYHNPYPGPANSRWAPDLITLRPDATSCRHGPPECGVLAGGPPSGKTPDEAISSSRLRPGTVPAAPGRRRERSRPGGLRQGTLMHILCPHCKNPVEVIDLRAAAGELSCAACGSSFRIARIMTPTLALPRVRVRSDRRVYLPASRDGVRLTSRTPYTRVTAVARTLSSIPRPRRGGFPRR
jgi:hypothetical protein